MLVLEHGDAHGHTAIGCGVVAETPPASPTPTGMWTWGNGVAVSAPSPHISTVNPCLHHRGVSSATARREEKRGKLERG